VSTEFSDTTSSKVCLDKYNSPCNEFLFSLADLENIRTRDKKGEFQITAFVTGQIGSDRRERRSSKDFKIKEKHLQDLGWN
jgi:hypothetical protein